MADRYLRASGNWSGPVWADTSSGTAGSAATPTASDIVYIAANYTVTLTADAECRRLEHTNGTLELGSYKLACDTSFESKGTTARTLKLDTGILEVNAPGAWLGTGGIFSLTGSNLTLVKGTSTVIVNVASKGSGNYFTTLDKQFYDVVINIGTETVDDCVLDITGSPTFRSLIIQSKNSEAHTVYLDDGATVTVDKFIAIGYNSDNPLKINNATDTLTTSIAAASSNSTCYGQNVLMWDVHGSGWGDIGYIGTNSSAFDSTGWLLQDPPKISTLVDPLTTAPGSNPNWAVSGTVTQVSSGHEGGGYQGGESSENYLRSNDTYDLVDSQLVIERPSTDDQMPGSGWTAITGHNYVENPNNAERIAAVGNVFVGSEWADIIDQVDKTLFTYPTSSSRFIKIALNGTTRDLTINQSNDGKTWSGGAIKNIPSDSLVLFRSIRVENRLSGNYYLGSVNPSLNTPPTTTLDSPANGTTLTTDKPELKFTATDPDGDDVTYQVQISTSSTFTSTHEDKLSAEDTGFSGTDPYDSGTQVTYTVQSALTKGGVTYYWRVRAKDPSGSDSWGTWSATRTMTTETTPPTVTSGSASSITTNSATVAGNVTSTGGASVTERGIVYGLSADPTTSDNKNIAGTGSGSFNASLTGLTSNTTYNYRAYAINSEGTSYGSSLSFTTLAIPPVVKTGTAGSITLSSAVISDNEVTSNPDAQTITERGVVYATTQNPTTSNLKVTSSGSPYNASLSSLSENTTYYVRAYIIWSGGTVYGSQVSFKTQGRAVTVPHLPLNNGSVSVVRPQLEFTGSDADADTITYHLQINTSADFTSPVAERFSATDPGFSNLTDAKADPFYSGNRIRFTFQTDVARGTDLYWRVRGRDSGSSTWGEWTSTQKFSIAPIVPSVVLNTVSEVTFDSASADGEVTYDGGATVTERGVVYSTSPDPTTADDKVAVGSGTGQFTANLTDLTGATKYYARAYAINSAGTSYSSQVDFTTEQTPSAPTVVTGFAENITDTTTEFNDSEVTLDGTQAVVEKGVVFSVHSDPTIDDRKIIASSIGVGSFSVGITGLDPLTTYYARAYAVNSIGVGYGNQTTFTTEAPFVPDEGDGYWTWAPDGSDAVVGRSQATPAYSSVDLMLADLSLEDGKDYTLYYSEKDSAHGATEMVLQRYVSGVKTQDIIVPGTPLTFTYDAANTGWSIRLFVTRDTAESDAINATFRDMYLAQESTFSGYIPFIANGLTEIKIENNWILDKRREETIQNIFNVVAGLGWYPFSVKTVGIGWLEIGDQFTIEDDQGDQMKVVLWETSLEIDGGMKEALSTKTPDKTETDYKKAGTITSSLKRTQISVDHNAQQILSLVEDVYSEDGVINTKFSEIEQTIDAVVTTVQSSGGVNLVKNSVMYAFDDAGVPDKWDVSGSGTIVIQASPESLSAGGISGNSFTLSDKTVSQTVTVRKDVDFIPVDEKQYYSFSAKVKKSIVGNAYINLSNRNESHQIDLPDQTEYYWEEVKIEGLLPLDDHFVVEISSDADANLEVTDVMLSPGDTTRQWTQANGEAMNTSVSIDDSGMTVRSNAFRNDYTKVTALGFEVHKHDVEGERVFGFNGDETSAYKLRVDKQISMEPLRIVPISYGDYKGWAFTLSEETE